MTAQAPTHLPEPGQIILQTRPKDQVDLVKVCTSCGLVVAWGYEERHAARHVEYDEQVATR